MNVMLPRVEWARALERVSAAVPSRSTLSALRCIAVEASDGVVRSRASSLSLHMRAQTKPIRVEREGGIALPENILRPLVQSLNGDTITLDVDQERLVATLTCLGKEYRIHGLPATELPQMPVPSGDDVLSFQVGCAALERVIGDATAFAARDETMPTICSVYFDATSNERVSVVGFNRHRLSVTGMDTEVTATGETRSAILPRDHAEKIARALPGGDVLATVAITRKLLGVTIPDLEVASALTEGEYPGYAAFVERVRKGVVARVKVNRRDLLEAVERLLILSDNENITLRKVSLRADAGDSGLTVSRSVPQVGNAEEVVPAEADERVAVSCSGVYLKDALVGLTGDDLELQFARMADGMPPIVLIEAGSRFISIAPMEDSEE